MDGDGAPSQPQTDGGEGDPSASSTVQAAPRRQRGRPWNDSHNSGGNATSSAVARRSSRDRTRSADSHSSGRSAAGGSGGSVSIGGSGKGARRSSSRRRAMSGKVGNDGEQGPSPSQRSRLTDENPHGMQDFTDHLINNLRRPPPNFDWSAIYDERNYSSLQ